MKLALVLKRFAVALSISAVASFANAGVVTFTGLSNYQNYSEDGMDMVSSEVWNWPGQDMAHMDNSSAIFTRNDASLFNLDSVDMIADGGSGPARFSAYLNGIFQGFVDVAGVAGTYNFGDLFIGIDEFRVTVIRDHFTFDNLVWTDATTDVPEPGSFALLGLGMLALLGRRRKLH